MAICPFATQQLIPPGANDPRIEARVAIWHVAVSMADSLFTYFNGPSGGIESHFYINWRGKLYQYRDTAFEADANYLANPFAVSVETAGWATGRWNLAQRRTMKRLAKWLNLAEGIPMRKVETWDGEGHGYHVQFGAPGKWTPVAKSCPGPGRVKQFNNWFVPWLERQGAPVVRTRGPRIDRALNGLSRAYREAEKRGHKRRARVIDTAVKALESLRGRRK